MNLFKKFISRCHPQFHKQISNLYPALTTSYINLSGVKSGWYPNFTLDLYLRTPYITDVQLYTGLTNYNELNYDLYTHLQNNQKQQ